MVNKYNEFVKAMNALENENDYKECKILIEQAQYFYSCYKQSMALSEVEKRISNIYSLRSSKEIKNSYTIALQKNQLSPISRLFLYFYRELLILNGIEMDSNKVFFDCIKHCPTELAEFPATFRLNNTIGKHTYADYIKSACHQAKLIYSKKPLPDLGLKTIEKAIQLYDESKELALLSKEACFNKLFSDEYVTSLIERMKTSNGILFLYTTPIRLQLCEKHQGGRNRNSESLFWCYDKEYRQELSTVIAHINKVKLFDSEFEKYKRVKNALEKKLLQIKNIY